MGIGRSGASRNKSATFWPIPESHLDTNLTASLVRDETLDPQDLYEDDQPMIDKPLAPTGTMPGTFSPLVRAVIDSVTEGIDDRADEGRERARHGARRSERFVDHGLVILIQILGVQGFIAYERSC